MPAAVFPNGTVLRAPTWRALLECWRRQPWNRDLGKMAFRNEVARRAIVWYGEPVVRPRARAAAFFEQCEEAHLLRLIDRKEDPTQAEEEFRPHIPVLPLPKWK